MTMRRLILTFYFLLLILSGLLSAASSEIYSQNSLIAQKATSLNFKPSDMVVMSLEEWLGHDLLLPEITEALIAYHATQDFQQSLKDFIHNPNQYFENRLHALNNLINVIPTNSRSSILKKLLNQARNKLSYILALPDMLDPRCSYKDEEELYLQKNLLVRDSYWAEFLDPLHRSGVEMNLYKHLWKVYSIPNFFIYLDTIEHSPLLEKYAPQNHQVKYFLSQSERDKHKLTFKNGIAFYGKNKFDTTSKDSPFFIKGYAIFVLGTDGEFYVNNYDRYNWQHSSVFAGQEVIAAGEVCATKGKIYRITNKSGHYSPNLESILTTLQAFKNKDVSLKEITVSAILGKGASSYSVKAIYNAHDLLLKKGKTLCTSALYNWTPLQVAVWKNQFSLANEAIKVSHINAINEPGLTALHIATQGGYLKWISFLIKQGADCNIPDPLGQTPLHIAALQGNLDAIKLLYNNSDVSLLTNLGASILLLAIKSGKQEVIEYLLAKNGIDVSQNHWTIKDRDNNENGPLYYAVSSNCVEMLILLLSKALPEEILKPNIHGSTLLHTAAAHSSALIFNLLLSYGLDPSLTDALGQNLLHYAVKYNNCKMVEFLLYKGFTWMLQAQSMNGITPLHYASSHLSSELFPTLLSSSPEINAPDYSGNTPLFYAVKSGKIQNALWLLKNGADIYKFNNDGLSPVHVSAASSSFEILMRALLSQVDVIDLLDAEENTPLQTALSHNNVEVALYLIPYTSIKMLFHENAAGNSALDIAKKLKNREVLDEINKLMTITKKSHSQKLTY